MLPRDQSMLNEEDCLDRLFVQGVTGHELCRYFWEYQYRMDWESE